MNLPQMILELNERVAILGLCFGMTFCTSLLLFLALLTTRAKLRKYKELDELEENETE